MRRQRYLRTPSAQSLCIFCTCRLTGELPHVWTTPARRRLTTGRATQQSASAAAVQVSQHETATPQPTPSQPTWTFDPSSSLTRSEQAERARLRQRRQERELAQQQALAEQRRQREVAAAAIAGEREAQALAERVAQAEKRLKDKEERDKVARQWRQQREAEEKERVARERREQQAEADAKAKAQAAAYAERDRQREVARDVREGGREKHEQKGVIRVRRVSNVLPSDGGGHIERPLNTWRTQDRARPLIRKHNIKAPAPAERLLRLDGRGGDAEPAGISPVRPSPNRREEPFAARSPTSPLTPPEVTLPSFGSVSTTPTPAPHIEDDGWGSGGVQTAPVTPAKEPVARRYDNLLAERPPPPVDSPSPVNPNVTSEESSTGELSDRTVMERVFRMPQSVRPTNGESSQRQQRPQHPMERENSNIVTANGATTDFSFRRDMDQPGRVRKPPPSATGGSEQNPLTKLASRNMWDSWEARQAPSESSQTSGTPQQHDNAVGHQSTPHIQHREPQALSQNARPEQRLPVRRPSEDDFLAALKGPKRDRRQPERSSSLGRPNSIDMAGRDAPKSNAGGRDADHFARVVGEDSLASDAAPSESFRSGEADRQDSSPAPITYEPVPSPSQDGNQERQQLQPKWNGDVQNRYKASPEWDDDVQHPSNDSSILEHSPEPAPPNLVTPTTHQPITDNTAGYYSPSPASKLDPSRQTASSDHDSSGYRATILDTQDYQPARQSFDETQAAEWQHLRRRNSEPSQVVPPTLSSQSYQPQQRRTSSEDTDWIDRQFREHVQQRPQQTSPTHVQQQQHLGQQEQYPFYQSRERMKCARCGEMGHIARECAIPPQRRCYRCRQVGHLAHECPDSNPALPRTARSQLPGPEREGGIGRQANAVGGREQAVRPDPFDGKHQTVSFDPFGAADRGREQMRPDRYGGREQANSDSFAAQEDYRRAPRAQREVAVDDVRADLFQPRKFAEVDDEGEDEVPAELVLRSRKFAEDAPKKEKPHSSRRNRDENDEDDEGAAAREDRVARKADRKAQKAQEQAAVKAEKIARKAEQGPPVNLPDFVSVATLAQHLGVRYEQFVGRLERLGYDDVFPGKIFNAETSGMIAMEYGFEPIFGEAQAAAEKEERDLTARPEIAQEDKEYLPVRPPVVTIMGHVDHGKTTILDYLRKSSVAAGEAGGITQHIGAFSVPLASSGRTITFLDTPGHAAFLAMRQRGAHVTDIVVLVVAADDSVKPQTLEAIKHAKAAGVPMIVAVNKIDKEGADLQRVKQDLARHGVEIEDFGGETQVVPVSGKTGEGMGELEENVVTLSEILDHRAETEGPVEGWVLEATTKKAGRVATVLVRRGTLRPGSVIVAGKTWARVRTLRNEAGQAVAEIGPGMPVEVDGWRDQPSAGDEVLQAPSEQKATDVVEYRTELEEQRKTAEDMEAINETRRLDQERQRQEKAAAAAAKRSSNTTNASDPEATSATVSQPAPTPDDQPTGQPTGQLLVPLIVKADVSGSAEAVSAYILSISSPLIAPQILRSAVGPLNESDVELADAARGHIIAFNLPADEGLKAVAARCGVRVLENNIIYRVLDDVRGVLEERLPALVRQRVLGEAEVGVGFEIGLGGRKKVRIAGCKVRNGVVGRGSRVRVMRGGEKVYDGTISSLKNVKKDVQEMRKGTECGMGFEGWEAFEVGDQVQTYEEISEKRKLQ
ncbi:translation initiation factor IF-2 [Friedmanniomyces endolithicus]|nr:translation initiation factor IF-2 [Friedmanniomyces endolithicus]KAK0787013.1 translation initiation factor IF-2 [Friedmanniomyces endolithicus]KAK0801269.1 translation initiation factor IF-2 [Friedmanniomyces endolithicus]KAK0841778.1 translation initiation factor IF-2 [Friedmanniomyces endolithicus]KAK0851874.1 translation initiation factor IF-2 [Friedmanniomyces endolithicus]